MTRLFKNLWCASCAFNLIPYTLYHFACVLYIVSFSIKLASFQDSGGADPPLAGIQP
jgi:hypothetical protein